MDWFEKLTGFREETGEQVRANLAIEGNRMRSLVNEREFTWGSLDTPSLDELRERMFASAPRKGKISLQVVTADVQKLHVDPVNAGALFQVASQFNLLEMVSRDSTPEQGVGIYENDRTQGPACAVAAGAGTIYRNYFVPVNGRIGQTQNNQIDCLADVGLALGNANQGLWKMRNGYVQGTSLASVVEISERIGDLTETELDDIRKLLRIGIHSETEVTLDDAEHTVTQAFCSALPLGMYSPFPAHLWEPFARLVLDASYESTICASALNASQTGNNKVYLTLVGGGVFQNDETWIIDAIEKALVKYKGLALEVIIVSHSRKNMAVQRLAERFRSIV